MSQRLDCKIFTNAAMNADVYSDWIDTRGMSELGIHLSWVATGAPVGSFKVEVSNDPVCRTELDKEPKVTGANSAAKKVDITSSITPIHGTALAVNNNAGETFFALTGGLPRFVRVWFDNSSGGSAASLLQGWTSGRE